MSLGGELQGPVAEGARTDTKSRGGLTMMRNNLMSYISCPALYLCSLLSHRFLKQHLACNMTFAKFTKLSQELRDLIWAEAAAIQCQQVRGNFFECNSLLLLH